MHRPSPNTGKHILIVANRTTLSKTHLGSREWSASTNHLQSGRDSNQSGKTLHIFATIRFCCTRARVCVYLRAPGTGQESELYLGKTEAG